MLLLPRKRADPSAKPIATTGVLEHERGPITKVVHAPTKMAGVMILGLDGRQIRWSSTISSRKDNGSNRDQSRFGPADGHVGPSAYVTHPIGQSPFHLGLLGICLPFAEPHRVKFLIIFA